MKQRCEWARSPLMIAYHDREWGSPVHDDRRLFEFLILEGAQAGLSWETVLKKRNNYRKAFENFDPEKIARYSAKRQAKLMQNPGIIRNRLKIRSAVENAKAFLEIQREFGSFDKFIWQFVGGKPICNSPKRLKDVPAYTAISDAMSKELSAPRIQVRWLDDLLCVHAGGRDGERSSGQLFSSRTVR